jgi:hypothetical protein
MFSQSSSWRATHRKTFSKIARLCLHAGALPHNYAILEASADFICIRRLPGYKLGAYDRHIYVRILTEGRAPIGHQRNDMSNLIARE